MSTAINIDINKQQMHLIGTLFEEEELNKKTSIYNQKAKDDTTGKKRFSGAFTGGWKERDVGFKGTCGSEDGFVPKAFVSNRNKRVTDLQQTITDYMDEEDLGKHIIGQNLKTNSQYDQEKFGQQNYTEEQIALMGKSFLGKPAEELIVNNQNSIGNEILQNLKRKRNQQIYESFISKQDTNEFFENLEDIDENEMNEYIKKSKDITLPQYQGLHFQQFQNFNLDPSELQLSELFNNIQRKKQRQSNEIDSQQKEATKNRIYVNPYGEEDDFQDEQQIYNTEIIEDDKDVKESKKQITQIISLQVLEQIVVKDEEPEIIKKLKVQEPPKDFDHLRKIKQFLESGGDYQNSFLIPEQEKNKGKMTIDKRANLLEDEKLKDLQGRIKTKSFVKGKAQEMGGYDLEELFNMDREKGDRYRLFCLEKQGKIVGGCHPSGMTFKQADKEKQEFELIMVQMELKNKDKTDIIKKIEVLENKLIHLKNFRKREKWFPEKTVCSRFNVPPPYNDQEYYYFKKLEKQNEQEFEKQKQIEETKPLTQTEEDPEVENDDKETKNNKLELKMYGLPTSFRGKKQAKFKSMGFQIGDNAEVKEQGEYNEIQTGIIEMDKEKQKELDKKQEPAQVKERDLDLFQSIFDDD